MKKLLMRTRNSGRGFTLLEVILALGIASFIGTAVITFYISLVRNSATIQTGLTAQQQIRKTFQAFVREVRSAERSAGGGYPILEVGTSTFTFFSNVDSDAQIERVRYYLGTSTLASTTIFYKEVVDPVGNSYPHSSSVLSTMVNDIRFSTATPIFYYYDANHAGTSTALAQPVTNSVVRLVQLSLPVDPNSARSPVYQTYTTQVAIRNLKDNL